MMQKIGLVGKFKVQHIRDNKVLDEVEFNNGIVNEGINQLLDAGFNGGSQISTWYIGLINNASFTALNNADTMASHTGWLESADYTEGTRREWTSGAAAARAVTNGTTVDFSINANVTLRGIFITSNNTKSGTTGVLWSTATFLSNVVATNGDTLRITYTLSG
jgi:hypothetical protein